MVERDLHRSVRAKPVRFSHGQFRFVVEALYGAGRNRTAGEKPVQDQRPMIPQRSRHLLHRLQA
jgi:hypothetical protein